MENGVLEILKMYSINPDNKIREMIFSIAADLSRSSSDQIQYFLDDQDFIRIIYSKANFEEDFNVIFFKKNTSTKINKIKSYCLLILLHMSTFGELFQISQLVKLGVLEIFCINIDFVREVMPGTLIEALNNIFFSGEALKKYFNSPENPFAKSFEEFKGLNIPFEKDINQFLEEADLMIEPIFDTYFSFKKNIFA